MGLQSTSLAYHRLEQRHLNRVSTFIHFVDTRIALTVAIEQDLLPLLRRCRTTLEFRINNWILLIIRIQHLSLRTMLLEQSSQEGCPTAAVLSIIWSRRDCFERNKFFQ
jgi:hypothetical protein